MSSEEDEANRREHGRKAIELKVEYKRLNAFFADYTRNISHGGTFIKTEKPLPIGTEFVFLLQVPVLEEPLSIQGMVRWIVQPGDPGDAGMGIQFQYDSDTQRAAIKDLVEGLMVDSLGRFLTTKLMERGVRETQPDEDEDSKATDGSEIEGAS